MQADSIYYFAYGSNANPERFRARVGEWRSRCPAWLRGHRLRFSANVQSEGGGGAVVDASDDGEVDGVLFEISPQQLAAMDREEFDEGRDIVKVGRRISARVRTAKGEVTAELYTVADDGRSRPPSERYLGHITRGLAAAGHGVDALDRVRRAARAGE